VNNRLLRTPEPSPGDVLLIGREASVQFADDRGIRLRVIAVDRKWTYDGWIWLTGYVRHEALFDRVEVGDLHRCPVVAGCRS